MPENYELFEGFNNGARWDPTKRFVNLDGSKSTVILDLGDRAKTILVNENTETIKLLNKLVEINSFQNFKSLTEQEKIEAGYGIHVAATLDTAQGHTASKIDVQDDDGNASAELIKLYDIARSGGLVGTAEDNNLRIGAVSVEDAFVEIIVDGKTSSDILRIEGSLALDLLEHSGDVGGGGVGDENGLVDVGYEIHGMFNTVLGNLDVGSLLDGIGDVNGDGRGDILFAADGDTQRLAYVFTTGQPRTDLRGYDIENLGGAYGFSIVDTSNDAFGSAERAVSVSGIGDVNDDGTDDFAIAVDYLPSVGFQANQKVHIVYGRDEAIWSGITRVGVDGTPEFDVANMDPSVGVTIDGLWDSTNVNPQVVAAGDYNGDNIEDLAITAPNARDNGLGGSGSTYVIYGQVGGIDPTISIDTLDGTNGMRITGAVSNQFLGSHISSAGDINGDGLDDLIIGAYRSPANGASLAGQVFVVFGRDDGIGDFDLSTLDGTNGFSMAGDAFNDRVGWDVTGLGDINNDGFDDVAFSAAPSNGESGLVHVIFGTDQGYPAEIDFESLDGTDGFTFTSSELNSNGYAGFHISGVGDVDGDSVDDFLFSSTRDTYLVFGSSALDQPVFDAAAIDGSNGYKFTGHSVGQVNVSGLSDVNADGINDLGLGSGFGVNGIDGVTPDDFISVIHGGDSYALLDLGDFKRDGVITTDFMMSLRNDYSIPVEYYGDPGTNVIDVEGMSFVIDGGDGNDTINAIIYDSGIVFGGSGNDSINASFGDIRIDGEAGDDIIVAGGFKDIIRGGTGNDTLTGGGDIDKFMFEEGFGNDRITDFEAGIDILSFAEWGGPLSFSDDIQISQVGVDTVVTALLTGDTVTLENTDSTTVSVFDFEL